MCIKRETDFEGIGATVWISMIDFGYDFKNSQLKEKDSWVKLKNVRSCSGVLVIQIRKWP